MNPADIPAGLLAATAAQGLPAAPGLEAGASASPEAATIRRLTCFDSLTGLPNRLLFREQLGLVLRLARRSGKPVALLLADIDDFRRIKHSLGQRGGDAYIRAVAARIGDALRDSDLVSDRLTGGGLGLDGARSVARLNGNEFAMVLSSLNEVHDAQRVAQRLREAVAAPLLVQGSELFPSLSIGVALFPDDADDPETLLELADIALGRAKDLGKDRVQFYSPALQAQASDRLGLETDLKRAVEQRQFFPLYQPRVDCRTGTLVGLEALARWQHPSRGVLLPVDFIDACEASRLIVPLGGFMLDAACQQNRQWQQAGLPAVPVGVNVSPQQVARGDFVATVARALERSGLAPQCLELEIVESVLVSDAGNAQRTFSAIKAMGVRIAIDDFGTGFSSLAYLRDFPFDMLKIDRSFVSGLPDAARTAAVTCAIVDLARRLGLEVVAEGVETEAQRSFLQDNGCHLMQGFLFAEPLLPDALAQIWRANLPGAG